jgi:hypothetical protein
MRYNIDTCSMLVEFRASVWTARKLDKSTTDEVVTRKNAAAKDAARVNKHLLAGRSELDEIQKHVTAMRNFVYTNTLPWSDNGTRLLPTVQFMDFDKRIQAESSKFTQLVDDFIAIYPSLITAQAMALGDMFKRDDFPSAHDIKNKFDVGVLYMPVPVSGDFRVDVGNAAAQELRDRLEKIAEDRVNAAMLDVRTRLKDHLLRMSDRLCVDNVDGKVKGRMFHESLVENGFELCDLVKSLNVINDPAIEQVRGMLEKALAGVTANELRNNMIVRQEVKRDVDSILSKFNW